MSAIKKWFGVVSAASVLGSAGVLGLVAPAAAAHAPSAAAGLSSTVAAKPNVNIKGKPAKWSPTKLSVVPKKFTRCTAAKVVFTITNKTAKGQTISVKVGSMPKKVLGTLPAHKKAGVCVQGPKGTKETWSIKGSKSLLHLTLK